MKHPGATRIVLLVFSLLFAVASAASWNNPYPAVDAEKNILYSAFRERPKTFDPARAYSSNEYLFIAQIYEPPFQYHYLKRPYTLTPLTAVSVPVPAYFDKAGRRLPNNAEAMTIAFSVYEIRIRPGIQYQPHPAFARAEDGSFLYHDLTATDLSEKHAIEDFPHSGTRELVAADYVYQIKRLAHPKLHSPILSVMNEYIIGMREYAVTLKQAYDENANGGDKTDLYLDLTKYPLAGVEEVDRYTYRVKLHGKYPQLLYWMAMPFFAPMPPEADRFFSQPSMASKNLTLDWFPVGSGAYMLTVNNPNRQMVLERNPNYHEEFYPAEGEPEDGPAGLLNDAGKRMPFIDKVIFSLDKESIPRWNKFLQGYYDRSAVQPEGFDQAIRISGEGDTDVSEAMKDKGIRLITSVAASTYYLGFNMIDPVVGGYSDRARKLRQAISIAIDFEERISIFENGRGIAAQGPLAPGIFGYREGRAGINPYVYDWVDNRPRRKPIEYARRLMVEAGYPDGEDPATGKPLSINYETPAIGPERKAELNWMIKQFKKLGLQLIVRATDYNRFQEKMRKGDAQIFDWGWNADYPDPENFLFLLYGPNKKVGHDGENSANYDNSAFNRLFERMKNMDNTPTRAAIIDKMINVARRDVPWIWGMHPKNFLLEHAWMFNAKPNHMANNTLKYIRLDPAKRVELRAAWNRPVIWPVAIVFGTLVAGAIPAVMAYRRRERSVA